MMTSASPALVCGGAELLVSSACVATVTDVVGGADVETDVVTGDVGVTTDDADAGPSFDAEPHAPQSPAAANSNVAHRIMAWTLRTACWFRATRRRLP